MTARNELRDCFLSDSRDRFDAAADAYRAEVLAERLTDAERQFLTFALDQAADEMSLGDGFTDEDDAALETFRRMAAGATA